MSKFVIASLEDAEPGIAMLNLIPDTHAWIKDIDGRFVYGNRLFFERFGFTSMTELVGKRDSDIAQAHLAEKYIADDAQVLAGGVVTDRLELIPGERDLRDWFLTSKWPIYNLEGRIIGTFGFSRHLNRSEAKASPFHELQAPIDHINRHFAGEVSIEALARACNLSLSALERRFRKHLGKTPHQYLVEVRLENARRLLLETEKPLGVIALETGFADHSHFTRAFNRRYEQTPRQARESKGR